EKLNPIGQLFAGTWARLRERFAVAVGIFLEPTVFLVLGQLLDIRHTPAADILSIVIHLIAIIFSLLASLALIALFGGPAATDFAGAYQRAFQFFWPSVWIAILTMLAVGGGTILLIVPGIMLAVQLVFSNYALVLEHRYGMGALTQSRAYIKGYWWAFVGRSLLLILLIMVAMLVILIPLTVLLGAVAGSILYGIFLLFITPFSVAYQYDIFNN